MDRPVISLVIPTYNPGEDFRLNLQRICEQQIEWPLEILVVDSGSVDRTIQVCASVCTSLPVRVLRVAGRFHHSATRNWAIQQTLGDYIVLTVQDARPVRDDWIRRLITPLIMDPSVAGVYGRQIPKPEHSPLVQACHRMCFGDAIRLVQQVQGDFDSLPLNERQYLARFDNVTSCIRRAVWEQIPFPPVRFGEDFAWAAQVLRCGYRLVYEPEAIVWHSHDRGLWHEFKRSYLMGDTLCRVFGAALFEGQTSTTLLQWAKWLVESWTWINGKISYLSNPEITRQQISKVLEEWGRRCERRIKNKSTLENLLKGSSLSDACIDQWIEFLWQQVSAFSSNRRLTALAFRDASYRLLSPAYARVHQCDTITSKATWQHLSFSISDLIRLVVGYVGLGIISAWKRQNIVALWLLDELLRTDPGNVLPVLLEMASQTQNEFCFAEAIVYDIVYRLLLHDPANRWNKNYVVKVWAYALLRVFGMILGETCCKISSNRENRSPFILRVVDSVLSAGIV